MATRTPRAVGTEAERELVRWLASHGWPHAERRAMRGSQDAGDITGTPGIAWSVKAGQYARDPSDRQVSDWLDELEDQRLRAGTAWGVLVTRRHRTGDPGLWWAWLPLSRLVDRRQQADWMWESPVRMHVVAAVGLLHAAGYGDEVHA